MILQKGQGQSALRPAVVLPNVSLPSIVKLLIIYVLCQFSSQQSSEANSLILNSPSCSLSTCSQAFLISLKLNHNQQKVDFSFPHPNTSPIDNFTYWTRNVPLQFNNSVVTVQRDFPFNFLLLLLHVSSQQSKEHQSIKASSLSSFFLAKPSSKSEDHVVKETSLKYKYFRWAINATCKIQCRGPKEIRKGKKKHRGLRECDLELKLKLYINYQVISFKYLSSFILFLKQFDQCLNSLIGRGNLAKPCMKILPPFHLI